MAPAVRDARWGYEYTRAARTGVERQRLGALLFWVPAAKGLGLDRPRLLLLGGVNLTDRNRSGEPFVLVGPGGDLDR